MQLDLSAVPPPSMDWDGTSLRTIGDFIDGSLVRGVREMERRSIPLPDWIQGRAAQDVVFGQLRSSLHAFSVDPQTWLRPSEPQITRGWHHFLSNPKCPARVLYQRQIGFIRAVFGSHAALSLPSAGERMSVECEVYGRHGGRDRYVDLVLQWTGEDGELRAAALEFKFGHHITDRQLSDYREIMKRRVGKTSRLLLAVVLADHRSYPLNRRRSKNWRVVLWRDLLRRIDKLRPDGDPEYARFRHMTWHRTHG